MPDDVLAALVGQRGHVLVITLNRPDAVNAELSELVGTALERAEQDPETGLAGSISSVPAGS